MPFDRLFTPIKYGSVTAANRVMQLATTNNLDDDGRIGERFIAFHEERARQGVGAIVTPGLAAHPSAHGLATSVGRSRIGAFDPATIDGFSRLATAVQAHGVPLFGQVFHGGRQHHATSVPMLWGPSAVPCPHSGGVPHEMSLKEIEEVVGGFVAAASTLQKAGLDGVEIHAAQGHLVQEFLSPFSNHRQDQYGGDFDNRMRFLREIIEQVRDVCGDTYVVGVRIAAGERSPGGIDLAMACEIAGAIEATGQVDYLSVSMGNFNSIEDHIPDRHFDVQPFVDESEAIREHVNDLPIIACGRILTPENAEAMLTAGQADAVGLCRPLLSDERWVAKAKAGHEDRIRVCISCNQCWGAIIGDQPILCIQNPVTGNEVELAGDPEPAQTPKRVVVVGGGPAGMEAARAAAERGHTVILFEKEKELGGAVSVAASIPGHGEIDNVRGYLATEIERMGVDIRLNQDTRLDWILDEMPDAVVVATGSEPRRDQLGAPVDFPVLTSYDVVRDAVPTGDRAIVFDEDGYYQAVEVAEMMAKKGTKVYFVTRFFEVGRELPMTSRATTLQALDELGVELHPTSWFAGIDGRDVTLAHYYSHREFTLENIDSLVHIGNDLARDDFYHSLQDQVPEVFLIGDAYQPRRIYDAISEGNRVGRLV